MDGPALLDFTCTVGSQAFLRAVEECVTPSDPMVMLYSSGSTADPKGAVHSHGAILRHSYNLVSRRDVKSDDRIWSPMPPPPAWVPLKSPIFE